MRLRRPALLAACAAITVAGCGGSPKPSRPAAIPTGPPTAQPDSVVLSGTLAIYGGVQRIGPTRGCGCEYHAGTVRLIGPGGRRIDVPVGRSGRFSVRVAPGRYKVEAGLRRPYVWPMGSCLGLSGTRVTHSPRQKLSDVTVTAPTRIDVECLAA